MQFTPYVKGTILENVDNNGFLRRNLLSCPQDGKEMAYKGLVQPILEYASPVWDPHGIVVQEELEKVQNRAARFVTVFTTLKLEVWLAFLNS